MRRTIKREIKRKKFLKTKPSRAAAGVRKEYSPHKILSAGNQQPTLKKKPTAAERMLKFIKNIVRRVKESWAA
jgi:HEPN domain-containing protein